MATGCSNEPAVCSFPSLAIEMRNLAVHENSPGHNYYHPNAKKSSSYRNQISIRRIFDKYIKIMTHISEQPYARQLFGQLPMSPAWG